MSAWDSRSEVRPPPSIARHVISTTVTVIIPIHLTFATDIHFYYDYYNYFSIIIPIAIMSITVNATVTLPCTPCCKDSVGMTRTTQLYREIQRPE